MNKTIPIALVLIAASLLVVFLIRASTLSASRVLEWALVLSVFALLVWLMRFGFREGKKRLAQKSTQQSSLNPRENDVLELLSEGLSNKEIAAQLHIAESTVKKHVSSVFRKLGAKRRAQAARIARDSGYLAT